MAEPGIQRYAISRGTKHAHATVARTANRSVSAWGWEKTDVSDILGEYIWCQSCDQENQQVSVSVRKGKKPMSVTWLGECIWCQSCHQDNQQVSDSMGMGEDRCQWYDWENVSDVSHVTIRERPTTFMILADGGGGGECWRSVTEIDVSNIIGRGSTSVLYLGVWCQLCAWKLEIDVGYRAGCQLREIDVSYRAGCQLREIDVSYQAGCELREVNVSYQAGCQLREIDVSYVRSMSVTKLDVSYVRSMSVTWDRCRIKL